MRAHETPWLGPTLALCAALLLSVPVPALAEDAGEPMAIEPLDAGASMAVEAFEPADAGAPLESFTPSSTPIEAFTSTPTAPTARVTGWVRGEAGVDTRFDSPPKAPMAENVAEGRFRGALSLDVKVSDRVRLVLEGRAQLRLVTQRDFERAKGFFEPMLGDAYVDLYTPKVDLRVGNQRVVLGANAAMAPADALNPRDLREGLVAGDLETALLPVFAVRAQGEVGKLSWLLAYAPFFAPHRYFVFGQDDSILQPGLGPSFDAARVEPSVEDYVQDRVLETKRPEPFLGDLALRITGGSRVKLGASWVWMNEKLPRVTMDEELSSALAARAAGRAVDPAAAVSLLNRFEAGETLYRGEYKRQHVLSVEGSALLGPGQLDVDVGFSPRATLFDERFRPVDKPLVTVVVGYSAAEDSDFTWALTYLGLAVPEVGAQELLILLEPATARGAGHTAFFHALLGTASYVFWKDRLEVSLRAAFEPVMRSFALAPRLTYRGVDGLELWLSAEVYEGPAWSPLGYYGRNDRVVVGARYDFQ